MRKSYAGTIGKCQLALLIYFTLHFANRHVHVSKRHMLLRCYPLWLFVVVPRCEIC